MKPDRPADTGVMIRRRWDTCEGLQVLVDDRRTHLRSEIDGYSRLAYSEAPGDETAAATIAFFSRTRAFYAAHGITRLVGWSPTTAPTAARRPSPAL